MADLFVYILLFFPFYIVVALIFERLFLTIHVPIEIKILYAIILEYFFLQIGKKWEGKEEKGMRL